MKTITPFLLIALLFTSCLKTDRDKPKPIIDYRTFGSVNVWNEIEMREANDGWKTISDGNSFTLFLNKVNDSFRVGIYEYDPTNLDINIDTTGDVMVLDEDRILFVKMTADFDHIDTLATVHYTMKGDSILILRNMAVTPIIELKFRHKLTHYNVRHN